MSNALATAPSPGIWGALEQALLLESASPFANKSSIYAGEICSICIRGFLAGEHESSIEVSSLSMLSNIGCACSGFGNPGTTSSRFPLSTINAGPLQSFS